MMITGIFGTSKTTSIMLYVILSNYIHKYTFAARDKTSAVYKQYLEFSKIFLFPKLKYWYWKINWQEIKRQKLRLEDVLLNQATELPK